MITSKNHHQPRWLPWPLWVLWNPVDAIGCRNEHTGVTDHAKVMTTGFVIAAVVLHLIGRPLAWWELIALGTLCFGSLTLMAVLLKSGIFSGQFVESKSTEDINETSASTSVVEVRQERDPVEGIDPT